MNKTAQHTTILNTKVPAAILWAFLPAALALAGCNQPPSAAPVTVVEKTKIVEVPVSVEEQTRRDEERRSRQPQ